jgi:type IV pilus assembly protein PilZ
MFNAGGAGKGNFLSLHIKEKTTLFTSYMPFVKGGGVFVPTNKKYSLGEDVFLVLTLLDDKDRLPVASKVVWITPNGAQGNRTPGIGVQFSEGPDGDAVRTRIESNLAGLLNSDKPTQTM